MTPPLIDAFSENGRMAFRHRAGDAGITEEMIRAVIRDFYGRVRSDPLLGPIFNEAIGTGWAAHLEKIAQFWLSATRLGGRYEGRGFMPAHLKLSPIGAEHLQRWLCLFRQTLDYRVSSDAAEVLFDIAARMAESIQFGIDRRDRQNHPTT